MSHVRKNEKQEEGKNERKRQSERQREVLGPHHRSPTHIPSTSTSLHYLHVNDGSLCPAKGRKRSINTTAERAQALFSPRRMVLLHPHTPTHVYTHAYTHTAGQRKKDGRGCGHAEWSYSKKAVTEEFLICSTKAENQDELTYRAWIAGARGLKQ